MAERQSTQQLLWFTLCLKINNFNERIVEWWLISKLSILSRVRHKHDSLECISIGSIVVLRRYFSFYFILCVCFSLDLNFILQKIGQFACIFSHHFSPDHRRHAIMFLFILGTCYCAIFQNNWTRNAIFQVEKGRHVEIYFTNIAQIDTKDLMKIVCIFTNFRTVLISSTNKVIQRMRN